jgi:predicted Kef-type K+ transport protein
MHLLELIRSHAQSIPALPKFVVGMAVLICVPPLCRRVRLPAVVGLFLAGILVGPHDISILGKHDFGVLTTTVPLVLDTAVGFLFGYKTVAAVVIGSLLASDITLR